MSNQVIGHHLKIMLNIISGCFKLIEHLKLSSYIHETTNSSSESKRIYNVVYIHSSILNCTKYIVMHIW